MRTNRSMLFGALAGALVWSSAASAVPGPTTFFGAPDLTVAQVIDVLWQTESTPCEGNDGGSPSMFILDPGCAVRSVDGWAIFEADPDDNLLPGLPLGTGARRCQRQLVLAR